MLLARARAPKLSNLTGFAAFFFFLRRLRGTPKSPLIKFSTCLESASKFAAFLAIEEVTPTVTTHLLVIEVVFTRGRLSRHHQRSNTVPSPGVAAFIGFAGQAKPVRFESAGASALHTPLPFGFNPRDARDGSLIGRGVLITPPFVGPLCRSECA